MAIHKETKTELGRQDRAWLKLVKSAKDNICILKSIPNYGEPFFYYHQQNCKFHSVTRRAV